MGILRRDVDRTSIEQIAKSYLDDFQETINTKNGKWENELSAEEQKLKRKARRVKIGNELFSVGEDKPFVFPAAFTFVFRAFTTLDGIGKGLDPSYDVARLCQPFLKELADLQDGSIFKTIAKQWGEKLGLRPVDLGAVVQQPRRVAASNKFLTELESGNIQLRVRALETERQLASLEVFQKAVLTAVALGTLSNVGIMLLVASTGARERFLGSCILKVTGAIAIWKLPGYYMPYKRIKFGS
eukprot:FR736097.1.p1 GENE.FR736097.1~~FR736097.1.p1  ORF type:complete len:242 (+),score=32.24 FR736097.1:3-728(+)